MRDVIPQKNASFSIAATGSDPLSYSWERELPGKGEEEGWQPLPTTEVERYQGADTAELRMFDVQKADEGLYRCVVMNKVGQAESQPATLTIESVGKIPRQLDNQHIAQLQHPFHYTCIGTLLTKLESACMDGSISLEEKCDYIRDFLHDVGPRSDVS